MPMHTAETERKRPMQDVDMQVRAATSALELLNSILSTRSINPAILSEFREALNRVRNTGWMLETLNSERAGVSPDRLLAQERIRCVTHVSDQLVEFLGRDMDAPLEGFETMLQSVEGLAAAAREHIARSRALVQEESDDILSIQ